MCHCLGREQLAGEMDEGEWGGSGVVNGDQGRRDPHDEAVGDLGCVREFLCATCGHARENSICI